LNELVVRISGVRGAILLAQDSSSEQIVGQQPTAPAVSIAPEPSQSKSSPLPMGLQELSRTMQWRSLPPHIKRILTSYLTEDAGNFENAVARYRVGWEKEKIAADAERIMQDPLVVAVLQLQRGQIRQRH
jgi:hypothetical protein